MVKWLYLGDELPIGHLLFILSSSVLFTVLHYHELLLQYKMNVSLGRVVGRQLCVLYKAGLSVVHLSVEPQLSKEVTEAREKHPKDPHPTVHTRAQHHSSSPPLLQKHPQISKNSTLVFFSQDPTCFLSSPNLSLSSKHKSTLIFWTSFSFLLSELTGTLKSYGV